MSEISRTVPSLGQVRTEWRTLGVMLALAVAVVLAYWPSFSSMVQLWSLSNYRHGYVVVAAVVYLIWRKRGELATAGISQSWPGIIALLALTIIWLMARAISVLAVEHFVALGMIGAVTLALLGPRTFAVALFPMLLLVAAAPVGEQFVPLLMRITAEVADLLLSLSGEPFYREGQVFQLPGGSFEVAEICAGISFLFAGFVTAIMFAYLTYVSIWKRLLFVLIAAAFMVLSNGVRAFLVMYLYSVSDGKIFAQDHVTFGMVVFAVTIGLLMLVGVRFADPANEVPEVSADASIGPAKSRSWGVVVAVLALLSVGPASLAFQKMAGQSAQALPPLPAIPGCDQAGPWEPVWRPEFVGADTLRSGTYRCGSLAVDAYLVAYHTQTQGKELISGQNVVMPPGFRARSQRQIVSVPTADGSIVRAIRYEVPSYDPPIILVWYSVGQTPVTGSSSVKLQEVLKAIRFSSLPSMAYVLTVRGDLEEAGNVADVEQDIVAAIWDSYGKFRSGDEAAR